LKLCTSEILFTDLLSVQNRYFAQCYHETLITAGSILSFMVVLLLLFLRVSMAFILKFYFRQTCQQIPLLLAAISSCCMLDLSHMIKLEYGANKIDKFCMKQNVSYFSIFRP
jgi:hypothetical protein